MAGLNAGAPAFNLLELAQLGARVRCCYGSLELDFRAHPFQVAVDDSDRQLFFRMPIADRAVPCFQ